MRCFLGLDEWLKHLLQCLSVNPYTRILYLDDEFQMPTLEIGGTVETNINAAFIGIFHRVGYQVYQRLPESQ